MEPVYAYRYFEAREDNSFGAVGKEHVIPMLGQWLPQGAMISSIKWEGYLFTEAADIKDEETTMFQLNVGVVPTVSKDTVQNVTATQMKVVWDQTFPKVDETAPGSAWTPSAADQEQGDTDTALMFQPGRLSLKMLTDPNTGGMMLMHERYKLGFFGGSGYKTGSGVNSRLVVPVGGHIKLGYELPFNSDIMWHWTNPADFVDDEWDTISTVLPRSNKYTSLQFLAPKRDTLTSIPSVLPSTSDDYRRFLVAMSTTGTRQWVQHGISGRLEVTTFFSRNAKDSILEDTTA